MGKSGKTTSKDAKDSSDQRSHSPTGSSEDGRQRQLNQLHGKLAASFPHQPHTHELEAEDLVPEQPGFIIRVPGFLSPQECEQMIGFIEQVGLNPPSLKDLRPKKGEALLNRESFAFEDSVLSGALWVRMLPFLPSDINGRRPIGLTSRNSETQVFEPQISTRCSVTSCQDRSVFVTLGQAQGSGTIAIGKDIRLDNM
mmetsp:Transcript_3407/g.5441  ORF Transcript_3407/g.5441 Transcript_3407/m.5441 type:complete len:198 (-) Transcript_3407:432-1025(-)